MPNTEFRSPAQFHVIV